MTWTCRKMFYSSFQLTGIFLSVQKQCLSPIKRSSKFARFKIKFPNSIVFLPFWHVTFYNVVLFQSMNHSESFLCSQGLPL